MIQEARIRYHKNKLNKYGAYKRVFSFDKYPQYIIKIWDREMDKRIKYEYKASEKYPDLFAKIIKIDFDRRLMIEEKLDTEQIEKDLKKLATYTGIKSDYSVPDYFEALAINTTQKEKQLKMIKQRYPEGVDLFNKWISFFEKIIHIDVGLIANDFNIGNIGYDKNGNLKLLDI